jgi:hypothetical protein
VAQHRLRQTLGAGAILGGKTARLVEMSDHLAVKINRAQNGQCGLAGA